MIPSEKFKIHTIYDLLEVVERRPSIFLGDHKISSLDAFLSGYTFSAEINNISLKQVFPPFWYFHEWVMKTYGWKESTAGWKNIILKENNGDEELSLKVCFELLREFKKLKPLSIYKAPISDENIKFHHSDTCKIKRLIDVETRGPLYEKVDKIFIIEFSHDFGFSIFIHLKNEQIGDEWNERYSNRECAITKAEDLFGDISKWENLDGNLLELVNSII